MLAKIEGPPGVPSRVVQTLNLDPDKILETSERLRSRIEERFEKAKLADVSAQLVRLARHAKSARVEILRPNIPLRIACYGSIVALLLIVVAAVIGGLLTAETDGQVSWIDLIGAVEASVNDLVLLGAAVYFFVSYETRRKRGRVVNALHDLRTLAHLIDVHQLTKNPEIVGPSDDDTASSPNRKLSKFEMGRYLDYCSEMLSLTGKVAALYGDGFDDAEAVKAINDLEELTINLQSKIWQKRMLLCNR